MAGWAPVLTGPVSQREALLRQPAEPLEQAAQPEQLGQPGSPVARPWRSLAMQVGQWAISGATLAKVVRPEKLKAVLRIPETQAPDVTIGQPAAIDTRNGIVKGHVVRMDPASQNGTVTVDVTLDGTLPKGARPDLSVDGTIEIERLSDVLHVGRPAY